MTAGKSLSGHIDKWPMPPAQLRPNAGTGPQSPCPIEQFETERVAMGHDARMAG
jgi:hypothetical protein